jgi:phosphate transport system substrate-binding protein
MTAEAPQPLGCASDSRARGARRGLAAGRRALLVAALAGLTAPGAFPDEFDLSGLPSYKPEQRIQGVIRIRGNDAIELIKSWEVEFKKLHYEIRFHDYLLTTPMGFSCLAAGTAELGIMGHSWWRSDLKGFEGFFGYPPLEIKYAFGSYNAPKGSTPGPVFFVHKSNPLAGLTLKQLDGIFGAQRTGGWRGTRWTTDPARGPEGNIRTWGQLGLTGAWADQPIHPYGIDATLSNWSDLIHKVVFKGGTKWNPAMKEIVRGGVETPVDVQLVQAVHNDPNGIAFSFMRVIEAANLDVKVLPLAADDGAPFIQPSARSFHEDTYPLNNAVYIYLNRPPGRPLPPRIKEFLRYVLSREGQEVVAREGTWIPLNAEAARRELKKVE